MEEGTAIKTEILEDFNLRNDSSTNQYVIKASHVPKSYKTHADDSSSEAESLVVLKR